MLEKVLLIFDRVMRIRYQKNREALSERTVARISAVNAYTNLPVEETSSREGDGANLDDVVQENGQRIKRSGKAKGKKSKNPKRLAELKKLSTKQEKPGEDWRSSGNAL